MSSAASVVKTDLTFFSLMCLFTFCEKELKLKIIAVKSSKYLIPGICGQNKGIIGRSGHFSSVSVTGRIKKIPSPKI